MGRNICWKRLDTQVIAAAAMTGSAAAFDALVVRYRGAAIGVAYSVTGHEEWAKDIAQEAFLIAYRALHQLEQPQRFPSWLCAIARNRAIRWLRERRREKLMPLMDEEPQAIAAFGTAPDPADILDQNERIAQLHQALTLVPHPYRVILDMYYWRRMKAGQIADSLALPETTVKWRLHKGKQLLKRQLGCNNP